MKSNFLVISPFFTFHKVHCLVEVHVPVGLSHAFLEGISLVDGIIPELALLRELDFRPHQLRRVDERGILEEGYFSGKLSTLKKSLNQDGPPQQEASWLFNWRIKNLAQLLWKALERRLTDGARNRLR